MTGKTHSMVCGFWLKRSWKYLRRNIRQKSYVAQLSESSPSSRAFDNLWVRHKITFQNIVRLTVIFLEKKIEVSTFHLNCFSLISVTPCHVRKKNRSSPESRSMEKTIFKSCLVFFTRTRWPSSHIVLVKYLLTMMEVRRFKPAENTDCRLFSPII